jgi:hypothetical protein
MGHVALLGATFFPRGAAMSSLWVRWTASAFSRFDFSDGFHKIFYVSSREKHLRAAFSS